MIVKVPLKNADDNALLDDVVYDYIINHPYLTKVDFLKNLRRHSRGYAFFQKNWKQSDGSYKNETIYLQKIVAEKFIEKPDLENRYWVRFVNGNPLDCRVHNLRWSTLSTVVRNTSKTENQFGYRGIIQIGDKFQAIIYKDGKGINLGSFDTPDEAALAYNKKSIELFGITKSLNKIREK